MSGSIIRVTLFKIPTKESQVKMAENYKTLSGSAVKVFHFPFLAPNPLSQSFALLSLPPEPQYNPTNTQSQDGKPYILSLQAGPLFEDARSAGFTFAAKSEFKSVEDMKYYDADCEAHKVLKANAKTLGIEGMMMVYYDPVIVA
jgi:hypothetical protein